MTVAVDKPELREASAGRTGAARRRRANFDGGWEEVDVLDRTSMGCGAEVSGPAIVEFPEATWVVREGWSGAVDGTGTLVLRRAS